MAKDVVRHPKRLKWVAFDRDVFKKLLGRLTELNDYLHEMMHGHQARALEVATQRTYLEMVQVRVSVDELKHLVTAAMLLQDRDLGSLRAPLLDAATRKLWHPSPSSKRSTLPMRLLSMTSLRPTIVL